MKDQFTEILIEFANGMPIEEAAQRCELVAKTKPKKKKNPYFQECLTMWFEFFMVQSKGMRPKITPGHGKALNEIIAYFNENVTTHSPTQCLEAVFKSWDRLDPFWQKNIDLPGINKNFNTIIIQIKNASKPTDIPSHWK